MSEAAIVFGLHAVRTLLSQHPQRVSQVLVQKGRDDGRVAAIVQLAEQAKVRVAVRDGQELDRLAAGERHQGVCAQIKSMGVLGEGALDELLDKLTGPPLLLVLDGVQDPHNLGACLRSAAAAGVTAVVIPKDKAVQVNATVRKTSAGAADSIPVIRATNLSRCLRDLQQLGVWIYGLAGEADASLYGIDLRGNVALVLGGEADGLRRLTREQCDQLVKIPMPGEFESLNVSVATGVALFEAVRQRA